MNLKNGLKELVITAVLMSPFALLCASCTVKAIEWQSEQNTKVAYRHQHENKDPNHPTNLGTMK